MNELTRRDWLRVAASGVLLTLPHPHPAPRGNIRIGACDWSIGQMARLAAFDVAREIGLDGLQISYNTGADPSFLSRKDIQDQYLEASARTGVRIASIGIAQLNQVPYKSDPRTEEWVSQAIDAARALNVSTILLAFFDKGELRNDRPGQEEVIRRLRTIAPKAEKNGVSLAIESYLPAEDHIRIIEAVGSKAVRVYYDFRNATDAGYDIYREIPLLGKSLIAEIHMKENGYLLEQGPLDWKRISRALADIGYTGWMQMEGALPKGEAIVPAYQKNLRFLKTLFPA